MKYWRKCGIMIVVLSDDGIGTRKDKMLANQASELVQKSLWRAHFYTTQRNSCGGLQQKSFG